MVAKTLSFIRRIREYTNISLQPYKKIKTLASGLFLILLHQDRIRKLKYSNVSSDEVTAKKRWIPSERVVWETRNCWTLWLPEVTKPISLHNFNKF